MEGVPPPFVKFVDGRLHEVSPIVIAVILTKHSAIAFGSQPAQLSSVDGSKTEGRWRCSLRKCRGRVKKRVFCWGAAFKSLWEFKEHVSAICVYGSVRFCCKQATMRELFG